MAFNLLKSFIQPEYLPLLKYANPKVLKIMSWDKPIQFMKGLSRSPDSALEKGLKLGTNEKNNALLQAYFYQIHSLPTWSLEFSFEHLTSENGETQLWKPEGFFFKPSETFRKGLSDLYQGYYESETEQFEMSLKSIGLLEAKDIMMDHFGNDGSRKIIFNAQALSNTIDKLAERAIDRNIQLDENFLAFGIMLLTLYNHLSQDQTPVDVKSIYLQSRKLSPQ
ncbi:MAG: hypothetical protein KA715_09100 [Xanthomonadaceae bacterium]|nr:hypothetical protein [Xanthomonadaceae bacterium]